jgi:hypothetical protein
MIYGISHAKNVDMIQPNQQRRVSRDAGGVEAMFVVTIVIEH